MRVTGWCVCVGWRQRLRICMRLGLGTLCASLSLYWFRLCDLTGVVLSDKNGLSSERKYHLKLIFDRRRLWIDSDWKTPPFVSQFFVSSKIEHVMSNQMPRNHQNLVHYFKGYVCVLCASACSWRAGLPLFFRKDPFLYLVPVINTQSLSVLGCPILKELILIWLNFVNWIKGDTINDCQTSVN